VISLSGNCYKVDAATIRIGVIRFGEDRVSFVQKNVTERSSFRPFSSAGQ
jgi:hypothetical protein